MKLTWFGGTTLRIHIGGKMLVIDADAALASIDRTELLSGADAQLALNDPALNQVTADWTPRRAGALIDETSPPALQLHRIAPSVIVVDAISEQPLLLVTGSVERLGRWTGNAVVVVMGAPDALPSLTANVLEQLRPKLVAVAGPEEAMDQVILQVKTLLDGAGLVSLEPGLALEV
ncbi:MAG TPA: hypothetical protein VL133_04990 [Devosia sp.]|nr:hypothetical protein [Devosia sp.]